MTVTRRKGESVDSMLRRFRKQVSKGRILSQYRRKRWFVSKSELRRRQKKKAIRKAQRRQRPRDNQRRRRR